jgi:uroporphyrin-III C-methyltransferase/precorrin-2 dehydrogenase/sirohydrochlorin ferrochelatase
MVRGAFPVFLDLAGRPCLVIGDGAEAERKASLLARAGAVVRRSGDFAAELLEDVALVIVAGVPPTVAEAASRAARERGVLVNVVDEPLLCSFIMPAIVDRAPVVIAISTGGAAPGLAAALRRALDRALPRRLGELALLAARFRPLVARRLDDPEARRGFWDRVFAGRVAALALAGEPAAGALCDALDDAAQSAPAPRDAA